MLCEFSTWVESRTADWHAAISDAEKISRPSHCAQSTLLHMQCCLSRVVRLKLGGRRRLEKFTQTGRGRIVTKQALLAVLATLACAEALSSHQWQLACVHGQYIYMCEARMRIHRPLWALVCLYMWECGFTSGSHICPNQNNVSQIKIRSTAPITPFPPLPVSLCLPPRTLSLLLRSLQLGLAISPHIFILKSSS